MKNAGKQITTMLRYPLNQMFLVVLFITLSIHTSACELMADLFCGNELQVQLQSLHSLLSARCGRARSTSAF